MLSRGLTRAGEPSSRDYRGSFRQTRLVLLDNSRPVAPTDRDVREWAGERGFFISSPMADTKDERAAAAASVSERGGRPVWFEGFGGRDDDPERAYLNEVDRSDVYLGILRRAYGRPHDDGRSATEMEYDRAVAQGRRVAVWVAERHRAEGREPALDALIERVRASHVTGAYASPAQLAERVRARIDELCAEDLSPWVKLGDAVFRAGAIDRRGNDVRIEASLRPGPILEYLQSLRPDRFTRAHLQLTYRDQSDAVVMTDLATRVASGTRTIVTVTVTVGERPGVFPMAFSGSGFRYTAEEAVAARMKQRLFAEELPPDAYLWCDFELDLNFLADDRVNEEIAPAMVWLLVTEALIGGGFASAIRKCEVQPRRDGTRTCTIAWLDLRRYTNEAPTMRAITGRIRA